MRKTAPALIAVAVLTLAASGSARAADPNAPRGAPASWLPDQPWVVDHWLPYDETRLFQILGLSRNQIVQWLTAHHDHASLAELAREQGVRVQGLAARLVGPRPRSTPASLYGLLVARTETTLTQPHLAHHMLGHLMHVDALTKAVPRIFGLSLREIVRLHLQQGLSFAQIGARSGISEATLQREITRVLSATEAGGAAVRQTPPSQAHYWLSLQLRNLPRWLAAAPRPIQRPLPVVVAQETHLYCHLI